MPASSPLFKRAIKMGGSSLYLPGRCIPMVPRELSEDFMSLNPNMERRALVFDMYLNSNGIPLKTFYKWSIIKSRWKGTYREVSEYYDSIDSDKDHWICHNREIKETIDLLREVGVLRRQHASDRQVVEYDNRNDRVGITLNDQEELVFETRQHYMSELYNEQIGLLCNSEGAKLMHFMDSLETKIGQQDLIQPIYRTQRQPRKEQLEILQAVITNTLSAHKIDPLKWGWDYNKSLSPSSPSQEKESIATYLERVRKRRDKYDNKDSPEYFTWDAIVQVVERQSMMTNVGASFTKNPGDGHFGLKMDYYARFSSPMRELVGCYTHKELKEGHTGSSEFTTQDDIRLRDKVIMAATQGKQLQKKLNGAIFLHMMNKLFYKDLLQKQLYKRPIRKGILLGMDFSEQRNKSRRCYVKLDEPTGIEVKVFAQDLEYFYNCRYVADSEKLGKQGSTISIAPLKGSFNDTIDEHDRPPKFKAGQRVTLRTADYAQF